METIIATIAGLSGLASAFLTMYQLIRPKKDQSDNDIDKLIIVNDKGERIKEGSSEEIIEFLKKNKN